MAVNLKTFRSILRKCKWIYDASKIPGEFQVIDIFAYVADATFLSSLTPPVVYIHKTSVLLHDIVITDGIDKLKCFLALPLSNLVQNNVLKVGSYIQINSVKLCYLEGEYGESHIVTYTLLEDITVVERIPITLPDCTHFQFLQSNNLRERDLIPLVTSRKHYVHVWHSIYPYGPTWKDTSSIMYTSNDPVPAVLLSLGDFNVGDWRRIPKPYPPMILRIIYRGILHHFGHNYIDKSFPFIGYFIAVDSTGYTNFMIFDKMNCGVYYNSFPGTVLLIQNYKVQELSRNRPLPSATGSLRQLSASAIEISVADYSSVKIVPNDCEVFREIISSLPDVEYTFVTRKELEFAADGSKVDIVGLITYVSRVERFSYKYFNFGCNYWLEVVDSSCHFPFQIIIYVDPNRFNHEEIHPGQILVATQLKVCHFRGDVIRNNLAAVYLQASVYTEMFTDHKNKAYNRHPKVLRICSMIHDHVDDVAYMRDNYFRVGGHYIFPPLPTDLESYEANRPLSLRPGAMWSNLLKELKFCERKRFEVGGFIVHVEFVNLQTVESNELTYGWAYCNNIPSKRTIFFNIKLATKITKLRPLNLSCYNNFIFPLKYAPERKEKLLNYQSFPPTSSKNFRPSADSEIQSIPVQGDGCYLVTIASLHYENLYQCILKPNVSATPHPTFLELLNGNYEILSSLNIRGFIAEPPRYTWNEVKKIQRTAGEASEKTFIFSLEAFFGKDNKHEIFIRRAFLCPPEQINIIMEDDLNL